MALKARARLINSEHFVTGYYICLEETTFCFEDEISEEERKNNKKHYIVYDSMTDWNLPNQHLRAEVDGDTVCMCSDMADNNHKIIYENDIVSCYLKKCNGIVKFNDGCFDIEFEDGSRDYLKCYVANHAVNIIGNIFD